MIVIGVTGNSGSGKTKLGNILKEKYNFKIIDADKIAKKLSNPGTEYLKEIEASFGQAVFFEDGTLNRKILADKIYTNSSDLQILNNLTFKFVVDEIKKEIEFLKKEKKCKGIVIDAPLLYESGLDSECNMVIALIADENVKIARICKRDNISEETVKKRLNIQPKDEYYKSKTKFIIENNDEEKLESSLENILKEIM